MVWLVVAGIVCGSQVVERGDDVHMRELSLQALDDAYKEQVRVLFKNMIVTGGKADNAARGLRKAIAGYRHAVEAIGARPLKEVLECH